MYKTLLAITLITSINAVYAKDKDNTFNTPNEPYYLFSLTKHDISSHVATFGNPNLTNYDSCNSVAYLLNKEFDRSLKLKGTATFVCVAHSDLVET